MRHLQPATAQAAATQRADCFCPRSEGHSRVTTVVPSTERQLQQLYPKLRDCWLVQAGEYIKLEEPAGDKQSGETPSTSYAASGSERSQSSEAKRRAVKVLLIATVPIDMQNKLPYLRTLAWKPCRANTFNVAKVIVKQDNETGLNHYL